MESTEAELKRLSDIVERKNREYAAEHHHRDANIKRLRKKYDAAVLGNRPIVVYPHELEDVLRQAGVVETIKTPTSMREAIERAFAEVL